MTNGQIVNGDTCMSPVRRFIEFLTWKQNDKDTKNLIF